MQNDTLTTLFGHNLWANTKLLELCATLSDAQLDATLIGTFGTIRETVDHIATAERSYFTRISTGQRYQSREDEAPLTVAAALELLHTTGVGLIEWAPKVKAEDTVDIKWDDGSIKQVPKSMLLTQAINHATEHRSQIMAILTQLGIQPPDLDGWSYFEMQG